jgi:hypothetical protein
MRAKGEAVYDLNRHLVNRPSAFESPFTQGVIDEHVTHHVRRDAEKMRAALPVDLSRRQEPATSPEAP